MLVFDIETNGLLNDVSKIHCIATFDTETETSYVFNNRGEQSGSIQDGINQIMESPSIAGHNIVGYDLPLFGSSVPATIILVIFMILLYYLGYTTRTLWK